MATNTKKIIKILKTIDTIWPDNEKNKNTSDNGPGRKQVYSELSLFKVFLVMKLYDIPTIKGIWRFLMDNKSIRKECGLGSNIDRSTLSRRLSDKIKAWF